LTRQSRARTGADSWLAACLACSLTAFVVGMFTYDAFSFIQVTFLLFILIGLGSVGYRLHLEDQPPRASAMRPGS